MTNPLVLGSPNDANKMIDAAFTVSGINLNAPNRDLG